MAKFKCRFCHGGIAGSRQVPCPVCEGDKGKFVEMPWGRVWFRCPACMSSGFVYEPIPCKLCRGTGYRDTW